MLAVGRVAERVERSCRGHDDGRTLRLAVLDELRRAVGFDAHAWLLTDPETEVGSAPIADVPCLDQLPRLIALKYLTRLNRWTGLAAVARLRSVTQDRREQSLVWRDLLAAHDVDDVVSVVFRDAYGCWGFLDLWRIGAGPAFSSTEEELLVRVAGPVTDALRRAEAHAFEELPPPVGRIGPAVLVLTSDLRVRAQTPETDEILSTLVPPPDDRRPIPAGAYNVAAQLLAVEAGVDDHPPMARVHLGGGSWLTLRAARIGAEGPDDDRRDIAVTIEPTAAGDRAALFTRACGFSRREVDLMEHLLAGRDTREVGRLMRVSDHTVQDHLKSIFAKSGTRSRRVLLTRALGR